MRGGKIENMNLDFWITIFCKFSTVIQCKEFDGVLRFHGNGWGKVFKLFLYLQ